MENQTVFHTLVLSGLSDLPSLQLPLFLVFLLVYLMTLTGNLLIVLLICTDSHLQTPMYFFLGTLACLDISSSSVTTPRMLFDLNTQKRIISLQACITQIYFMFFVMSEVYLLAVMSYDRYIAICRPLHYVQIMHWKACVLLVSGVLISGMVYSLVQTLFLLKLTFCSSDTLQSFFCDLPQLLENSCSDTFINRLLMLFLGILLGMLIFVLTFSPYIILLKTIMKIQSKHMRSKAFSTCSSHFTVTFIFYVTGYFNYLNTNTNYRFVEDSRVASVFYAVLTPLMNPIIYSLRNQDLKKSLKRALERPQILGKSIIN
ncbi:hypothetical protein GDO86_004055 [Hymenochirus boettgeri]|uniref:Olfactory receptor n=1 Tax=Hymenochirus boettgeri TaxID=247094 RepID=A0A8T2JV58_9PIPI|nr:hypothetical protein GDO86_013907 [Hymenochirus boettgeri]KAG8452115.1 hypothetical protein GDO86_004055 [Hymenochirus boettgeri]